MAEAQHRNLNLVGKLRFAILLAPGLALIALGTLSGNGAPISARPTASYNLYPPLNYVVLGDSVSAGEGIGYQYQWSGYQTHAYGITVSDGQWYSNGAAPTWEDPNYGTTCHRSTQAFGFQLRDMLQPYLNGRSMNVTHLACTGATTDNVLASTQSHPDTNPALPTVPFGQLANPAYDAAQPDLVSLSVGANDLDFANVVKTCFTPWVFGGWQCGDDSSLQIPQKMDHIAANLPQILQTIWDKGMAAGKIPEVLLMTYYDPFPDPYALCNDMSFNADFGVLAQPSPAAITWLRQKLLDLNQLLRNVAAGYSNVRLVDNEHAMDGHRWCSYSTSGGIPWVYGPSLRFSSGNDSNSMAPFHPTPDGQAALGRDAFNALATSLGEGSFIGTGPGGNVYRIVGSAALHVSDCGPLGGCPGLSLVDQWNLDLLQSLRRLSAMPTDGTFVRAAETGNIYRIAGGAPLHISDCSPFASITWFFGFPYSVNPCSSALNVNQWTIDHLNAVPVDGTFLRAVDSGNIYRVFGGSPYYVPDCGPLGGCTGEVGVNQWTIDALDHLRPVPTPTVAGINPPSTPALGGAVQITIDGSGFGYGSSVSWNGMALPTSFISFQQVRATISGSYLGSPQVAEVRVTTPGPGGGSSAPYAFFVTRGGTAVSSSNDATSAQPWLTATASTGGSGPETQASFTATANGTGTVAVAEYLSNPAASPTFAVDGGYADVYLSRGSTFSSVTIIDCDTNGGTTAYWFDGSNWHLISNQQYANGCITISVNSLTSPTLSQLTGTVIAAGTPPAVSTTATTAGKPYLAGTWTNQEVTVSFSCSPAATSIAGPPVVVSTEGEDQSAAGRCTDLAGAFSTGTFSHIDIDLTPPTVTIGGVSDGQTYINLARPTIAIEDVDAQGRAVGTSGVDPSKTLISLDGQAFSSGSAITRLGVHTLTVSATDFAGNTATKSTSFRVKHTTALTYGGPSAGDYSDPTRLSATLIDTGLGTGIPVSSESVEFVLGSGSAALNCTGTTDQQGGASCTLSPDQLPGPYSISIGFAGDDDYVASAATALFQVELEDTKITYVGATTQDYGDPVTVSALLSDPTEGTPNSGKSLSFRLGTDPAGPQCAAVVDAAGRASCSLTPTQPSGTYAIAVNFGGDAYYLPSTASAPFLVTKEESTLQITSSPTRAVGAVTVSARLLEDGQTPIAGRSIAFSAGGVSASATTDTTGLATATLALAPGQHGLHATFASDPYYLASTAPAQTLFVYQPTQFVIWGGNRSGLVLGQDYTFWGSQWAKQVTGGEYGAGNSFKGYASKATGDSWTTRPGDASPPPASIASYIGVLVSDNIVKSGSVISGDVTKLVVLHVENPSAYQGDPGHSVAGEFVAVIS